MRAHWYAFRSTFIAHLKQTMARSVILIALFVQPIVFAVVTHFIYQTRQMGDLSAHVILGGGMAGVWSALTFSSASDLNRERYYQTIGLLVASQTSLAFIFSAKIAANAFLSLSAPITSLLFARFFLGLPIEILNPFGLIVAFMGFLFGCSGFALCLSALFLLSRSTQVFMNSLEYLLLIVGGILFPISILPTQVRTIAQLLPLAWGMEAMRSAFREADLNTRFVLVLTICIFLGMVYFVISGFLIRVAERRARMLATLDLF